MQELISAITQASGLIEKGGIVAVLMIVIGTVCMEVYRLRKLLTMTYAERDKARMINIRYRSSLNNAQIIVDISDIQDMFKGVS